MKTRPVGADLFPRDRLTEGEDTTKLIFLFRNFANAPTNAARYEAYVLRTSSYRQLDEKEDGQDFRFCTSDIRKKSCKS